MKVFNMFTNPKLALGSWFGSYGVRADKHQAEEAPAAAHAAVIEEENEDEDMIVSFTPPAGDVSSENVVIVRDMDFHVQVQQLSENTDLPDTRHKHHEHQTEEAPAAAPAAHAAAIEEEDEEEEMVVSFTPPAGDVSSENVVIVRDMDFHVQKWLSENTDLFSSKLLDHLDTNECYGLLSGHVQSGKSFAQMALCMYTALCRKQSVVWVLRNSVSDKLQALGGIERMFGPHSFVLQTGWMRYCIDNNIATDTFLTVLDNGCITKKNKKSVTKALERGTATPSVIIVLANHAQLERVRSLLPADASYSLFLDEFDAIGVSDVNLKPKRDASYLWLKEHASNVIGCSATNFSILFGDAEMDSSQVYRLGTEASYKGVEYFTWEDLSEYSTYTNKKSVLERDSEMIPYFNALIYEPVFEARTSKGVEFRHPIIVLNKSSTFKGHQKEFLDLMSDTPWMVITYNADGISITHPYLFQVYMDINSVEPIPEPHNGNVYFYKNIQIGDVLEHFRSQDPQVELFTHIVIMAGNLADRGINFVSNNYSAGIHRWHITHMYYKPTTTSDCTALLQSMRPCGNYDDDLPITVSTYELVRTSVLDSLRMQEEIIDHAIQSAEDLVPTKLPEFSRSKMLFSHKPSLAYKLSKKVRVDVQKLRYADEEKKEEMYDEQNGHRGYLSFKTKKQQEMYNWVKQLFIDNNYTRWTPRGIFQTLHKDRPWDIRSIASLQNSADNITNIQWKKEEGKYFYRLV